MVGGIPHTCRANSERDS